MILIKYKYIIANYADDILFKKQCEAIEKVFPDIQIGDNFSDVDGSLVQEYCTKYGNIKIKNDRYTDVLRVTSSFDLLPFFKN